MAPSATALRQELDRLTAAYRERRDPELGVELFRALGWDQAESRIEPDPNPKARRQYRLMLAGEAAGLVLLSDTPLDEDVASNATNAAYNSGIDWAAITSFGETRLLNARWINDPTFLQLRWTQYARHARQLTLLSPESMINRRLDVEARSRTPANVLRPLDQHLLDRLDAWRRMLLACSSEITDESVHELVGRLLFIRSCEDRGIIAERTLADLARVASDGARLHQRLLGLFRYLAAEFDSELFRNPLPTAFDGADSVLAAIVAELYTPYPGLPTYKYDFSYLNVDVLGRIYERYVSTILERQTIERPQIALFAELEQAEVRVKSRRKEQGVYYTPPYIVNYIVRHTVEQMARSSPELMAQLEVADISCGSGAFLTRSAERLAALSQDVGASDGETNARRRAIRHLVGVDLDSRAVTLARVNLWTVATMGEPPRPLPELGTSVFVGDALTDARVDALRGNLDVVVGNPPFRSVAEIDHDYQAILSRRYASAAGRYDVAYAFLERAIDLVKPGGYVGFVLPNRAFVNVAARHLRRYVTQNATIERIVDFGAEPAFEEGTSYASIIILRKGPATESSRVRVHRILKRAESPWLQLRRGDLRESEDWQDEFSQVFSAPHPMGGNAWVWSTSDADDRVRLKLEAAGAELRSIATIRQGVKTGDNRVFLLQVLRRDLPNGRWQVQNGLGMVDELEPDLLRPAASGHLIQRFAIPASDPEGPASVVLFPHLRGRLLEPFELQSMFPASWNYLERYRDRLSGRSTGARGRRWYDASWSRGEDWLDKPKILARELMPCAAFAVDDRAEYVPIGGVAVVPNAGVDIYVMAGVLNSSLMTWYLQRNAARFSNDFLKLVPTQLARFCFPWESLAADRQVSRRIEALVHGAIERRRLGLSADAHEIEIDALLFHVLNLDDLERSAVRGSAYNETAPEPDLSQDFADLPSCLDEARAKRGVDQAVAVAQLRDRTALAVHAYRVRRQEMSAAFLATAVIASEGLAGRDPESRVWDLVSRLMTDATAGDPQLDELVSVQRELVTYGVEALPAIAGASDLLLADHDGFSDDAGQGHPEPPMFPA